MSLPLQPRYTSVGTVLDTVSWLFNLLYGIRLVPTACAPGECWHPDVRRLDVMQNTGSGLQKLGTVYCDLFARSRNGSSPLGDYDETAPKSPHPAQLTVRCSRRIDDDDPTLAFPHTHYEDLKYLGVSSEKHRVHGQAGHVLVRRQLPVAVLSCDFSSATLSWNEVETVFHEVCLRRVNLMLPRLMTSLYRHSDGSCIALDGCCHGLPSRRGDTLPGGMLHPCVSAPLPFVLNACAHTFRTLWKSLPYSWNISHVIRWSAPNSLVFSRQRRSFLQQLLQQQLPVHRQWTSSTSSSSLSSTNTTIPLQSATIHSTQTHPTVPLPPCTNFNHTQHSPPTATLKRHSPISTATAVATMHMHGVEPLPSAFTSVISGRVLMLRWRVPVIATSHRMIG